MSKFTIFPARRVITMNPALASAEAVAVKGDRILGVGSLADLKTWGDHQVDDTFRDHVLTPGFVEAHAHAVSGAMWKHVYVGFFDRRDPDGRVWPGCKSIADVVDRLREAEADMTDRAAPLLGWGLDPIQLPGERLIGHHLDAVSETRPIYLLHASQHLATVNTAMLRAEGIDAETQTPGVPRGADGQPNGELQEPAAMSLAAQAWRAMRLGAVDDAALWNHAFDARNNGHTLLADLGGARFTDDGIAAWDVVVSDPAFPCRMMVAAIGPAPPEEYAQRIRAHLDHPNPKLRFGIAKFVLDGSIQGFTARLNWPYYHSAPEGSAENGLWVTPPEMFSEMFDVLHQAGITVHVHCNGDQAAQVFIDTVEAALERYPRWDHRHTVQHCQLTTPAQYRKMAQLGMCANIFSNHIFYWGDEHAAYTVGPERAARMDACATAEREGVPYSFHSDAPITPLGHLHVMWCAVNRFTASGQVLGPDERISVDSAMRAATIGAAYQLKMDQLVGSIEAGKFADFAVLADDPYEVDPATLKDIEVWGTVLGGEKFEVGGA